MTGVNEFYSIKVKYNLKQALFLTKKRNHNKICRNKSKYGMEILPADWGGSRVAADAVLPPSKSIADSYLPTGNQN